MRLKQRRLVMRRTRRRKLTDRVVVEVGGF
jgi:hypothetical protein